MDFCPCRPYRQRLEQDRIPSATAIVKNIYLTPQITDAPKDKDAVNHTAAPEYSPQAPAPAFDDGKIYISIIVSGLGLSSMATERAVDDLPPQVTLAFSPYADDVHVWVKKALSEHHETLMLLPMETSAYPQNDPGPRALSSRFSDQDNDENLNWLLTQGDGSVGVMNLMGSALPDRPERLTSTFTTLRKNDAMFIETPDMDKSAAADVAGKNRPALYGGQHADRRQRDRQGYPRTTGCPGTGRPQARLRHWRRPALPAVDEYHKIMGGGLSRARNYPCTLANGMEK